MQYRRYTQFLNLPPDDQPLRDAAIGRPAVLVTGFSSHRSTGWACTGRAIVVRRPRMPAPPPQRVSPPGDAADLVYRDVCRESLQI